MRQQWHSLVPPSTNFPLAASLHCYIRAGLKLWGPWDEFFLGGIGACLFCRPDFEYSQKKGYKTSSFGYIQALYHQPSV